MMTQSIFLGKLSSNWGSCQLPDKSWDIFHFSIKQAGQNLFMHGPPYSLPLSTALEWDLPSAAHPVCLQLPTQVGPRGLSAALPLGDWRHCLCSARVEGLGCFPSSLSSLSFLSAHHTLPCGKCWGGLEGLGTVFVEIGWKVVTNLCCLDIPV